MWPREFRRAVDEANKLKAAQAEEAEVLAAAPGMDAFDQLKKLAAEGGCCAVGGLVLLLDAYQGRGCSVDGMGWGGRRRAGFTCIPPLCQPACLPA